MFLNNLKIIIIKNNYPPPPINYVPETQLFRENIHCLTISFFVSNKQRGIGISSWNAGFYAKADNTTNTGNSFNNLYYGIKTYAFTGLNKPISIDGNTFSHNITACYLGAETFVTVTNNTFNITKQYGAKPDGYSGLYLDACTGYHVEENEFYSDYKPQFISSYAKCYGLVINNSGSDDNMIYNNYFHKITYATQAQGQNRSKDGQTGLQYKCNLFEDNYQDISVAWEGTPSDMNGIAENQGSAATEVTAPAGNRFSQLGAWSYSDFDNEGKFIHYHMPNPSISWSLYLIPLYSDPSNVERDFNFDINPWTVETGCPSHLNGKSYSELNSSIAQNEVDRSVYADSLDTKTDDGNTTLLNLDVVTSMPPETMQLRDQLLSASPYLSDTVMVNAAEKEEVLPNSIVTEILVENPQSAKAENVLDKLNERTTPPSDNQMAQIHANDSVLGAKERLESKKAYYVSQKQQNVNNLVRLFMSDTLNAHVYDSIETALSHVQTPGFYYLQAFARYNKGDSTGVQNKLSDVTSDFDLNSYENNMQTAYEDYYNVMLALQSEGKNVSEIDSTQKAVLHDIVQNAHGMVQALARNILIKTHGLIYHEPYILPDTTTTKSAKVKGGSIINTDNTTEHYFKLYPNPAKDYLTLEYQIPLNANNVAIGILNITGTQKEVIRLNNGWGQKIIDLRAYRPGTYFVLLYLNGKVVENKKFVKF